jgi:hypothetical protein
VVELGQERFADATDADDCHEDLLGTRHCVYCRGMCMFVSWVSTLMLGH